MILKLILLAIIGIAVYKLLGGRLPKIGRTKKDKVSNEDDHKKLEEDTLVECVECGIYVTYKESIIIKGKVYCSRECANL